MPAGFPLAEVLLKLSREMVKLSALQEGYLLVETFSKISENNGKS